MKRLIATAAFAALAVPAFAVEVSKPYEELDIERAMPTFEVGRVQFAAVSGSTVSDAAIAADDASHPAQSPWTKDYNFIAPAQ